MTIKTKSERFRRLVSHGYFAPELPPCFTSAGLARYRKSITDGIDALPPARGRPAYERYLSEPATFYFPRFARNDRRHAVPNPIAHLLLSRVIAENYGNLRRVARRSTLSSSPVVLDWAGSRALVRPSVDNRDAFRVELSSRREEYAAADLRAFFHSIYTHAIPWAIYGKDFAKTNRGPAEYGNLIDVLCRNAQDGQTVGLPVGPDTSRLIAEVIASAIDVRLCQLLAIGEQDASRYIDDYTLSSPTGESAHVLLAAVRSAAAEFELELNNDKTKIVPTSALHDVGWKEAARSKIPAAPAESADIQLFFYEIGRLSAAHPDLNVEKYALQNARSVLVGAQSWDVVQRSLVNAYRRNASLVSFIVEVLILRQAARRDVDLEEMRETIESRLPVLVRSNRSGELIWLLFLAIRLGIRLSAASVRALSSMQNAFVALLTVCAGSRDLLERAPNLGAWNASLTSDGLRGPMWLYAYEAVSKGFLPDARMDFIERDAYFSLLLPGKVQFLEIDVGFTSIASTLRTLRDENDRLHQIRLAIARARDAAVELDDVLDPDDDADDINADDGDEY